MTRRRVLPAAVALAAAALAEESAAQFLPGWQFSGTNTARAERYGSSGDTTQGPYQLDLGNMGYDDLNLVARLQESPYSLWRFSVSGVLNGSPYRSPYDGFVPERLNALREDGEAAIPYRAEAGDFFAFTSLRTLQRSLKGVSIEVQPSLANPEVRQSLVVFGGAYQPYWRDAKWDADNTVGASYLLEHPRAGRINVNVLRNEREALAATGTPQREQWVGSVAGETLQAFGDWKIRLEAEAAAFKGDHEFGTPSDPATDRRDHGLFAQVSGFDAHWNWRLRGERYGKDYRPNGAITQPDRRSLEAHLGYLFNGGLLLRGRYQDYSDLFESNNPIDTKVAGANLSGSIASLGLSGSLDAFVQDQENRDRSLDSRFGNLSLTLSKPFANGWVGQALLLRQEIENRVDSTLDSRTSQAQASVIIPLAFGNWRGSVAPGVAYRDITGPFASRDWQPTIMVSAFGGAHRLNASAGYLGQAPRVDERSDVAIVNFAIDYRYRLGPHELGLDWTVYDRRPSPGQSTRAYRMGVFWTMYLDQVLAGASPARGGTPIPAADLTIAGVVRSPELLVRLAPGSDLEAAVKTLADGGITGGVRQPNAVVYEARLLSELEQRQRLVLAHDAGQLDRSALIVSLADQATGDDASRTYERVRRVLLDRFGNPSFTFDEGAFGPGFAADLAAGRFIRLTEWTTQAGNTVRLGIPRRLDGLARIEIHHARRFPGPRDTIWGLDAVR